MAMCLKYAVREGQTYEYSNVMSLYPYVCKYFKFPLGHPRIHACQDREVMLSKKVPIKLTVLRPKGLFHPVLTFRCSNNFLFCLCRTCAVECNF